MKTKFHLRKGSKKSTISYEFRNGTHVKFRASTSFIINSEKDWDLNRQRMKIPSSSANAKLINSKLSEFDNLFNDLLFRKNEKNILFIDLCNIVSTESQQRLAIEQVSLETVGLFEVLKDGFVALHNRHLFFRTRLFANCYNIWEEAKWTLHNTFFFGKFV